MSHSLCKRNEWDASINTKHANSQVKINSTEWNIIQRKCASEKKLKLGCESVNKCDDEEDETTERRK